MKRKIWLLSAVFEIIFFLGSDCARGQAFHLPDNFSNTFSHRSFTCKRFPQAVSCKSDFLKVLNRLTIAYYSAPLKLKKEEIHSVYGNPMAEADRLLDPTNALFSTADFFNAKILFCENLFGKQFFIQSLAVWTGYCKYPVRTLAYRRASKFLNDSICNCDDIRSIARQEKRIALEEKDHTVALIRKAYMVQSVELNRRNLQRNTFLMLATAFLFFSVLASYAYHQKCSQNKVISIHSMQLDCMNRTKDQLFSIVAHDLRSPLQNMKHILAKLQAALSENDIRVALKLSGEIECLSNSTYSLLNNLLYWAMSQTEQLHFARDRLDMKRIVEQVCYDYKSVAASKEIALKNNVSGALFCLGDMNTIKLILRNLIDNAIKYSGNTTEIIVSSAEAEQECMVAVQDSGCGIDERIVQALFSDSRNWIGYGMSCSQSTGIGLWLAKTMAERNGGRLHISRADTGTLIHVFLPKCLSYEQTENTHCRRQS